jgi:hypothetical protein
VGDRHGSMDCGHRGAWYRCRDCLDRRPITGPCRVSACRDTGRHKLPFALEQYQKLARQVFLVAAYAAVVLNYLDLSAEPSHVSWISDRDAILQRHDGIVWDLATIMFYVIKGHRNPVADGEHTGNVNCIRG